MSVRHIFLIFNFEIATCIWAKFCGGSIL